MHHSVPNALLLSYIDKVPDIVPHASAKVCQLTCYIDVLFFV